MISEGSSGTSGGSCGSSSLNSRTRTGRGLVAGRRVVVAFLRSSGASTTTMHAVSAAIATVRPTAAQQATNANPTRPMK